MLDPFSLMGILTIGGYLANRSKCKVCHTPKPLSKSVSWTCCDVPQCPDCAAKTNETKSCSNCGHKVQ